MQRKKTTKQYKWKNTVVWCVLYSVNFVNVNLADKHLLMKV